MSTLSQFAAGGIKSIQRGTISSVVLSSSTTATITAVNTTKTILNYCGCSTGSSGSISDVVRIALTSSTTITLTPRAAIAWSVPPVVSYEVIEYF